jgi:pyruvate/2-oxoglutarate/acetoin dehydrogenase E1 component
MARVRYMQALAQALRDEMAGDEKVVVLGEDVRQSLRRVTAGLVDEFGPRRVLDTPLSEQAFTGFATGASMVGWRPVVEYQIPTLVYVSFDQIVNQAQKLRLMTGGQVSVPVTYVLPGSGARRGLAGQHSDHPYALLVQAGVKTVVPALPDDAYSLFRAAIRCDDPVVVIAPAAALGIRQDLDGMPTEPVALGSGRIHRRGEDVTVVAVGHLVQEALKVATELADEISIEVFDPRTLLPFDWPLLFESVTRTRRLVVFDDSNRSCGLAGEIVATVLENLDLAARPVRITRADIPVPFAPNLEAAMLPSRQLLIDAIRTTIAGGTERG